MKLKMEKTRTDKVNRIAVYSRRTIKSSLEYLFAKCWPKVILDDRGITIRVMCPRLRENTVMPAAVNGARLRRGCKM